MFKYAAMFFVSVSFLSGSIRAQEGYIGVASGMCRSGTSMMQGVPTYNPFMTTFIYFAPGYEGKVMGYLGFVSSCMRYFAYGCFARNMIDLGANPEKPLTEVLSDEIEDMYHDLHWRIATGKGGFYKKFDHFKNDDLINHDDISPLVKDLKCFPGPEFKKIKPGAFGLDDANAYRPLSLQEAHRINKDVKIHKPVLNPTTIVKDTERNQRWVRNYLRRHPEMITQILVNTGVTGTSIILIRALVLSGARVTGAVLNMIAGFLVNTGVIDVDANGNFTRGPSASIEDLNDDEALDDFDVDFERLKIIFDEAEKASGVGSPTRFR